ncbi:MAG: AraC family transcriptional regulator [Pseudomonadota bacterium]
MQSATRTARATDLGANRGAGRSTGRVRLLRLASYLGPEDSFHIARTQLIARWPVVPHAHDFFEVFWIEEGLGLHLVNGVEQRLEPGQVHFIRPRDVHALRGDRAAPCRLVNLSLPPETVDLFGTRYGEALGARFFWGRSSVPDTLTLSADALRRLRPLADRASHGARTRLVGEALLAELLTTLTASPGEALPGPGWLADACAFSRRPDGLRAGVTGLVRKAGRSREHVSRAMRTHLGLSPTDYVNAARMEHAAYLLRETDLPILTVAEACGIEAISHFYRLFQSHHGQTPRRYRSRRPDDLVQSFGAV